MTWHSGRHHGERPGVHRWLDGAPGAPARERRLSCDPSPVVGVSTSSSQSCDEAGSKKVHGLSLRDMGQLKAPSEALRLHGLLIAAYVITETLATVAPDTWQSVQAQQ